MQSVFGLSNFDCIWPSQYGLHFPGYWADVYAAMQISYQALLDWESCNPCPGKCNWRQFAMPALEEVRSSLYLWLSENGISLCMNLKSNHNGSRHVSFVSSSVILCRNNKRHRITITMIVFSNQKHDVLHIQHLDDLFLCVLSMKAVAELCCCTSVTLLVETPVSIAFCCQILVNVH